MCAPILFALDIEFPGNFSNTTHQVKTIAIGNFLNFSIPPLLDFVERDHLLLQHIIVSFEKIDHANGNINSSYYAILNIGIVLSDVLIILSWWSHIHVVSPFQFISTNF